MQFPASAIVNLRQRNLARLQSDGIDFGGAYDWHTGIGAVSFSLRGTQILHFAQADAPTESLTSLLSTQNNPIDLRFRTTIDWRHGPWAALLAANFTDGYRNIELQPNQRVASWTTFDAHLQYDIPADSDSLLENTRVALSAENLFNVSPPFLDNQIVGLGFDQENANSLGLVLRLIVRKTW